MTDGLEVIPPSWTARWKGQPVVVASVAFVAASALVFIFLWVTYWLANRSFEGLITSVNVEFTQLGVGVTDSGEKIQSAIQTERLESFLGKFEASRNKIEAIRWRIALGDGMLFWLPSKRDEAQNAIKERIGRIAQIVVSAPAALHVIKPVRSRAVVILPQALHAREAAASLGVDADASDFEIAAYELGIQMPKLHKLAQVVDNLCVLDSLSADSTKLCISLYHGISAQVNEEINKTKMRLWKTRQAISLLAKYKEVTQSMAKAITPDLLMLMGITSKIQPNITMTNGYLEPLREFLRQSDEPIVDGMLGAALSTIGGDDKVSTFSLVKKINPAAGAAIDAIRELCARVETANNEISGFTNVNSPLMATIDAFSATGTRRSMLSLAHATKRAASYYSSQTTVFDPVLSKTKNAMEYIELLSQAGDKIPVPVVQSVMLNIAKGASRLIDVIGQPFEHGRMLIINIARTLENMSAQEDGYVRELKILANDG